MRDHRRGFRRLDKWRTGSEGRISHLEHACRRDRTRMDGKAEQWFEVPTRRLLRRGGFTSRDDLEARITAFTTRCDKNARPCRRSYDSDAEHARYLDRHPQPGPCR